MKHVTTLSKARRLPVGVGESRSTAFELREWTGKDDKVVGKMRAEHTGTRWVLAADILNHFLVRWGDEDVSQVSPEERRLKIEQAYVADVVTAWTWLRIEAIGHELPMLAQCSCKNIIEQTGNLLELDFAYWDGSDPQEVDVRLPIGFAWRDRTVKTVTISQMRWLAYSYLPDKQEVTEDELRLITAMASIVKLDGEPCGAPTVIADSVRKRDIVALQVAVSELLAGPIFMGQMQCPKCKRVANVGIPWAYDPFFTMWASSQSSTQTPA